MNNNEFPNIDLSGINWDIIKESNFEFPKISVPNFKGDFEENERIIDEANRERYQREVENNESLKSIVEYNEKIANYNETLISFNEKILNKLNSLDNTLLFLNGSFSKKMIEDKDFDIEIKANLLELIKIMDSKDSNKVGNFLSGLGGDVAAGLIVAYFQMKFGIS